MTTPLRRGSKVPCCPNVFGPYPGAHCEVVMGAWAAVESFRGALLYFAWKTLMKYNRVRLSGCTAHGYCEAAEFNGTIATVRARPGRLSGLSELAFPIVNGFCVALLCRRAGRLTAESGGFRPGQDVAENKRLLGTVPDLTLMHWPCITAAQTLAAWKGLEAAQAAGHSRAIGVSNFNASLLAELLPQMEIKPAANQCGHSIGHHTPNQTKGTAAQGYYGGDDATVARVRVISDCHFSVHLNRFIPGFISYLVAIFLK
jgi:hypothetical protein